MRQGGMWLMVAGVLLAVRAGRAEEAVRVPEGPPVPAVSLKPPVLPETVPVAGPDTENAGTGPKADKPQGQEPAPPPEAAPPPACPGSACPGHCPGWRCQRLWQ